MMVKRSKVLAMLVVVIFLWGTLFGSVFAYDKSYTTYMAGNAHIDSAWLWTTSVTRTQYIPDTFNQAVNLMNSNPDYTFNASAAQHFKWMKQDNPTLYNSVKQKIANGQLNIVGGQWLEPDLNIPSGESLARQSLYGQRYFQQEFGKKCTVGFVPDVFGFNAQMPQILKKSGMDYFVTTKLNWNDTNSFQNEIFKWQAIDGTQVIAYKPRSDYSTGVESNNVNYTLDEPNRHGIKKGLVLYGSGDRGGGPTQTQITDIKNLDADETMPNVKMYTVNKYFNDLTATDKANVTDVWNGEMYLENHRGTYTSQALIKKNNRLGEITAEEAEKFSSMANWMGAASYPQTSINSAWELIMLNQFHDILPGSGTNDQVTEAQNNGKIAINSLNNTVNNAITAVASKADTTVSAGVPVVVFNSLSFGRKQAVETSITFSSAPSSVKVYDNGTEIPSQILSMSGNTAKIVFIVDNVPSMGYKVVNAVANTGNYTGSTGLTIGSNVIENDLFRVEINGATGNIKRIYDKTNAKEVLSGGEGNVLQILDDTPANWDAWNVDYDDMTAAPLSTLGSTSGISIVENGPVKCTYKIDKSYGSSTFSQFITLYPGINRVDVRMTANWHESQKMLKVAFPWNVSGATSATYEIAYGAWARSNQRDTNFNKARFEVAAHKWADLSNGGYGVSLLNNCKYGYDTYQNTMRMSLLRSPKYPDANCDMGTHEFTYSIYPHSGDWKSANTVYKGYELNYPLIGYQTSAHTGEQGKSYSFMSINVPNVILSAVKKAEDSSDYIIRMYESQGTASTNATITLPGNITSISETNLLEENIGTVTYSGKTFSTTLKPYEIKTFKASFGGTTPPVGDTNIALNKTAAANQFVTGEEPSKAVDGTSATNSKWCSNVAGDKWMMLDLSKNYTINRWVVRHAGDGGENTAWNTSDFKLQKSTDGSNWTDVDSVTGNIDNITDRNVADFTARYVRLYITKPTQNTDVASRIFEFELYGKDAAVVTSTPTSTPSTSTGYKVSGYMIPDLTSSDAAIKSGFKVELMGTAKSALTDNNGYYEVSNVPANAVGYTVRISKTGYLSRDIINVAVNGNVQIGTQSTPVDLWAGDVVQDNVINMADIMELSKCFNSVAGDGKYNASVDFNKDNAVNMSDIMIITKHFNKTATDYPVVPIGTQTATPTPTATPSTVPSGDITEGGTITVSDNNSPAGEGKENAFDNNVNTKWLIFQGSGSIQYDFTGEDAYVVKSYSIASANDAQERDPKNWTLSGSNDGQNWVTVDTRSNEDFPDRLQTKTYTISNNAAYKIYKLELTCDNGTTLQLSEIQLFGPKGTPVIVTVKPTPAPTPGPSGDWSNFQAPTVVFQDQATGLEGSTIFHAAVPNVEQMMKDTCLEICKKIYNNNSEARNNFTKLNLLLTDEPNGVAWKAGDPPEITIGVSAQYLATFYHNNGNSYDAVLKEVAGILAHEGTHGYQYSPKNCGSYTQGTDFFGFIEGLADYTRTVTKGFTPPRYPRKGGTWTDGYNTTGFFIEWIVKNKKPTFAIELNRTAADYSTWSWDTACKNITGEGVQSLWNQYQQSIT